MRIKSSKKSHQLFFKEELFWELMRGKEAKNSSISVRSFEDRDRQASVRSIRFLYNEASGLLQILSISGRASLYFCKQLNPFIHNLSLHLNMALRGASKGLENIIWFRLLSLYIMRWIWNLYLPFCFSNRRKPSSLWIRSKPFQNVLCTLGIWDREKAQQEYPEVY